MGQVGGLSSNGNRFIGLATGLDTDAQIKKMLMAEQNRIDRVKQQKQMTQWKQEEYVDITKEVKELKSTFLDILSPNETNLMKSSAYTSTKATIENAETNGGIVDATSLPGARSGKYKIKVKQMATAATVKSGLDDLKLKKIKNNDMSLKLTVEGKELNVIIPKKEYKTQKEFISDLKNCEVNKNDKTKSEKGKLSDYVDISFSELTGEMTIASKKSGSESKLKIEGSDAKSLGICTDDSKDKDGKKIGENRGQNAIVYIKEPGQEQYTKVDEKLTNEKSFTIDNIKYDIMGINVEEGKSEDDIKKDDNNSVTINVKSDVSGTINKMKKFVEKYNSLLEKVNGKLSEKKSYKFKPLTEAQRKDMKEDERKEWDKKAKEGVLRNDMDLSNMLSQMRSAFIDKIEDAGITASEIGITTSRDYTKRGKLQINEEKLTKALEKNSDKIQELFTRSSSKTNVQDKYKEEGIFCRINDILDKYVGREGTLIKKAGYKDSRWAKDNDLSKNIVKQEKR
nr:flagellar filament capping protein FliD [Clostridium botulinum]